MKKITLTLVLFLGALSIWADDSGTCGEKLTWTFSESTGTLTISGSGDMDDYADYGDPSSPWGSYKSKIKKIDIKEGVSSIGNNAFANCSELTEVCISEGVILIGNGAFYQCIRLESVDIPNSVIKINGSAFLYCDQLKEISLGENLTEAKSAFNTCHRLKKITFHCKKIGNWFDYDYKSNISEVIIEQGVDTIAQGAFSSFTGLTSIEIPSSLKSIEKNAFRGCTSLNSVHIADLEAWCKISFASIESNPLHYAHNLFMDGKEIINLVIPDGIITIGNYAFENCTSLASIEISNGVTSIGRSAFQGCTGLTSIDISKSVTSIADATFSGCTSLTTFVIPNSVTSIGGSAFSGCSGLTEIHISSFDAWCRVNGSQAFNSIGDLYPSNHYLFLDGEKIQNAVIPEDVEYIDNVVFGNTIGIESLKVLAKRPPKVANNFASYLYETCTLYVPEGSENAYYVADGWKNFKKIETIKEEQPEKVPQDINGDGIVDTQDVLEIYKYIQEH